MAGGTYVAYNLNLLGPMMQMTNAASTQAVEIGKARLREFLENNDTARKAVGLNAKDSDAISMDTLDSRGKRRAGSDDEDDEI